MSQYKLYRACPVCNSLNANKMEHFSFTLFDNHPMRGGYEVVQCTDCNFIYADTKVTQDELDGYYANLSKYEDKTVSTGGGYSPYDKDRLQVTANYIYTQMPEKDIAILDLGCANGGLLRELKNIGYTNVVGVDPSLACVEITKNEVGCPCYHYSLFDIDEKIGKYDLIIISHVWEHILDIQGAMKKLETVLNKNGAVYIECPNAQHYKNVIHAPFQEFNTEHINHFFATAFENLFGLLNYKKIDIGTKVMKLPTNEDYDAVYGVFQKQDQPLSYRIQKDDKILPAVNEYINKSRLLFGMMEKEIDTLIDTGKPMAFFGIGQLSFKLLSNPQLVFDKEKLFLFDNNPLNRNKSIKGISILPGSELLKTYQQYRFDIIITSTIFEDAIKERIEEDFTSHGEPVPLFIGFRKFLVKANV
jgi:2-polyprenyl-3-methyl-5-hydroxy-6-metoxy-1,4-benzoquinol methylase